jgi:hypothetical protein
MSKTFSQGGRAANQIRATARAKANRSRVVTTILLVVLSPFLVPLIALGLLVALTWATGRRLALIVFCLRNAGSWLLVCSARRGWREFIDNNVHPVLPADVAIVWFTRRPRENRSARHCALRRSSIITQRPYLAWITWSGIKTLSLDDQLRPLKRSRLTRRELQRLAGQQLRDAQQQLQAQRSVCH